MPSYKVLSPGFINGRLYDPDGKRPVLHADQPFPKKGGKEQVPSWLEAIQSETAAEAKKRKTAETKAAKAAAEKSAEDKKDIAEASFMGEGEKSNTVTTL